MVIPCLIFQDPSGRQKVKAQVDGKKEMSSNPALVRRPQMQNIFCMMINICIRLNDTESFGATKRVSALLNAVL